jgi:hypothetical protein
MLSAYMEISQRNLYIVLLICPNKIWGKKRNGGRWGAKDKGETFHDAVFMPPIHLPRPFFLFSYFGLQLGLLPPRSKALLCFLQSCGLDMLLVRSTGLCTCVYRQIAWVGSRGKRRLSENAEC